MKEFTDIPIQIIYFDDFSSNACMLFYKNICNISANFTLVKMWFKHSQDYKNLWIEPGFPRDMLTDVQKIGENIF